MFDKCLEFFWAEFHLASCGVNTGPVCFSHGHEDVMLHFYVSQLFCLNFFSQLTVVSPVHVCLKANQNQILKRKKKLQKNQILASIYYFYICKLMLKNAFKMLFRKAQFGSINFSLTAFSKQDPRKLPP